ncbi:hypothetical protein [Natronogracilivirga saccharolytica]|uniref:PKD domain-containing protein n=1 Tax=Natronogracilivirga saccharolytica TaxID=2812953 RepID=A0A8J7UWD5_9BACT|nr:hypothetical protein [Natronogracilivirga saccharolytica]MBP3192114.1 hypothetical protein [Natronogracilivirga saccharolytica]
MYHTHRILTLLIAFSLPLLMISCDDSTSSNDDLSDVPELPPFQDMALATGIFTQGGFGGEQEALQKQLADPDHPEASLSGSSQLRDSFDEQPAIADEPGTPAFILASTLVNNYQTAFFTHLQYANTFTSQVNPGNAEMSDDEYVWELEIEDQELDETVSITVTANTSNDAVEWVAIASSDASEGGIAEQQVIDATTSADGRSGEWTVSLYQEEFEFDYESTITWEFGDDALEMLDLTFDMSEGGEEFYFLVDGFYNLEQPVASITDGQFRSSELTDEGLQTDVDITEIFDLTWDVEQGDGSLEMDGVTMCWDETQADTDC